MRLEDWINGEYQSRVRLGKLNGVYEPRCQTCYNEEISGSSSKRLKENLKSKIDNDVFELTYQASPDLAHFEFSKVNQGLTDVLKPTSYHISLGNECNYACKMCGQAFHDSKHEQVLAAKQSDLAGRVENILKVVKEGGFTSYNTDVEIA
jgi:hypothetical protein